jgi:hypothetical protein
MPDLQASFPARRFHPGIKIEDTMSAAKGFFDQLMGAGVEEGIPVNPGDETEVHASSVLS